ncbi:MAG: RNA polymerase sigma24 factor [Bacteroidia bacterium]|nr:MAG: RNA polymerase sigma24 factor [Bacteroidia bacterium]
MKKVTISQTEKDRANVAVILNSSNKNEVETAFNNIFKDYKAGILQKMMLGVKLNKEVAKDLMMDVFMKVHCNIKSYNPDEAAFSTWIYTIANNRLIDYKRTEKYEVLSIEDLSVAGGEDREETSFAFQIADNYRNNNGYDKMVSDERATLANNAIASIKNEVVRECVRLRFIEELSYEEIVEKTNVPLGSVKAYVNRGKDEMRKFVECRM